MKYFYMWILCLLIAGFFIRSETRKNYSLSVALKGLASLCFVILGFLSARLSKDGQLAHNVISGLCLGLIADVLLNLRFVLRQKGNLVFLAGILVFLAGHIFYIIALIPKCGVLPVCLGAAAVLTAVLVVWIYRNIAAGLAFRIFGVFYLGAIMVMTSLAIGILLTDPSAFSSLFAAGAVLFLASDIILILNTFGSRAREWMRVANLLLYYTGQLLIATSLQFI